MPRFIDISGTSPIGAATEVRNAIGLPLAYNAVSVKDYGATGDGVTDDTDAIEDAFAATSTTEAAIYFPPGTYIYNGSGLTSGGTRNRIRVLGSVQNGTTIKLGASSYFIDWDTVLTSMHVENINFDGGLGAIRHTYETDIATGSFNVYNCRFYNFTEAAIASDNVNMPYWHIRDCVFYAANTTTSIGIALGAGSDCSVIEGCDFSRQRIGIKLRRGINTYISQCGFLNLLGGMAVDRTNGPTVGVWVVPHSVELNAGDGLTMTSCKFGNEGPIQAGDMRILYADEKAGANIGVRMPELDADSTGYITGHNITLCSFNGSSADNFPVIYSTTPNVSNVQVHHNNIRSNQETTYVIEFRTPTTTPSRTNSTNVFGPFTASNHSEVLPAPASNAVGVGYWNDPQGAHQRSNTVRNWPSGSSTSYRQLLTASVTTVSQTGGASKATITDAYGGSDAITLTFGTSTVTSAYIAIPAFTAGMPVWVEFDVANTDDGNDVGTFKAMVRDASAAGFAYHWQRIIAVPSVAEGWVTYAYTFTPRTTGAGPTYFQIGSPDASSSGKTANVGRLRIYHANERQIGGRRSTTTATTTIAGSADLANDLRNKLIAAGIVSGTPSSGSVNTLGQVSTIELGHASDTTISRASAGQLAVEGNPLGTKVAVPASAGATGVVGQWAAESGWLYICVAANTWERVAIASW